MEWSDEFAESTKLDQTPRAVGESRPDRFFLGHASTKVSSRTSRTPAQDRLRRLQQSLQEDLKKSQGATHVAVRSPPRPANSQGTTGTSHVAVRSPSRPTNSQGTTVTSHVTVRSPSRPANSQGTTHVAMKSPSRPVSSVQNRLKVAQGKLPPSQATKRKAQDDEMTEVPEKKRHVMNSPSAVSKRPKLHAKRSHSARLKNTQVGETSNWVNPLRVRSAPECSRTLAKDSVSPPKKAKPQPNVIQEETSSVISTEKSPPASGSSESLPQNDEQKKDSSKTFFVVVDTNVFCHNLIFLSNILNMKFPSSGYATLVIPYIVLQELDNIKHNSAELEVSSNKAIQFINEKLQKRHPQVRGQSAINENTLLINALNPDDSIINCCLQIKGTTNKVILLSNDINLRNKAICNQINAYKPKDLREDVPIEFL